jgi:hypothetical protein
MLSVTLTRSLACCGPHEIAYPFGSPVSRLAAACLNAATHDMGAPRATSATSSTSNAGDDRENSGVLSGQVVIRRPELADTLAR